ncbi:hypothetical protein DYD21_11195 [Rhodohalobacter sp. SW132]|uniref:ester cyclase n=1 Tax=Rhodohalobacter sp. SW132 TaxID=2293433 RepID=UPI000E236704|nr:ester cyclase [Rhodohalobacter sp. SW132]REL33338.1 hypothetical protein DYD21_11195 [Rhodohalobacter sp. SW132]
MKEQKTTSHLFKTIYTLIFGLVFIASSCQQADRETAASQNEELAMQYIEAYNEQDRTALEAILTDPFFTSGEEVTLDSFLDLIEGYWSTFPDITLEPTHIVGADEHVTIRLEFIATGSGEFLGHEAEGKEINVSEIFLFVVRNGQLAEYWYNWDELGFWMQLGVVESPYPQE